MNRWPASRTLPLRPGAPQPLRRVLCLGGVAGVVWPGSTLLSGCATDRETAAPAAAPPPVDHVAAFSAYPPGGLPIGWEHYILRRDRKRTDYRLADFDGRTVLRAEADSASSALHCAVSVDPRRKPWLRWQWRVDAPLAAATVADDDLEDTPVRIAIAFDGDRTRLSLHDQIFYEQVELFTGKVLPYATLTYVWDGQLPVGRVVPYVRTPRIQYLVVESGQQRAGQWLSYERNLVDDYLRVFGEPPGRIIDVGVMTDSDDLKTRTEAWYGDIGLYEATAR